MVRDEIGVIGVNDIPRAIQQNTAKFSIRILLKLKTSFAVILFENSLSLNVIFTVPSEAANIGNCMVLNKLF